MKMGASQLMAGGKVVAQVVGVSLVYLGAAACLMYPVMKAALLGA